MPGARAGCAHAFDSSAKFQASTSGDWQLGPTLFSQDGAHAYDAVKEILKEEGPSIHTRMTKADLLMAKDGALGHETSTGLL